MPVPLLPTIIPFHSVIPMYNVPPAFVILVEQSNAMVVTVFGSVAVVWVVYSHWKYIQYSDFEQLCAVYCVSIVYIRISTLPDNRPKSENCQKMVWNSHRPTCRFNAAQMALAEQQGSELYGDSKLSQHLRKFVSRHEELIQWAAVQALEIKRAPFNMTQKALVIVLDHRPHPKSLLQSVYFPRPSSR